MKKIGISVLTCMFLLLYVFSNVKNNVKANEETNINLFEDFVSEEVKICYYCEVLDDGYDISSSLQLFIGTHNGNPAYIIYSTETNQVIEYSFNSINPWGKRIGETYILFHTNESFYYVSLKKENNEYKFYYDSVNNVVDNDLGPLFQTNLEYEINRTTFNYKENVVKQNSIDNAFYFENLNINYGDNINHTCGELAIAMYLAYVNEFLDSAILPNTLELTESINDTLNTYSITKDRYYNSVYDNNYDITSFESPGGNDYLHQFIIKYAKTLFGENQVLNLGDEVLDLMENYLDTYYNDSNIDMRIVSDFRYISDDEVIDCNNHYPESYEYYEAILDRDLLKNNDYINSDGEYQFDIFKEIDNGNPVVLFLNGENWELNLENYDQEVIKAYTDLPMGHVAIVYGYIMTESGIYYRCHFGHKVNNESYNNNDVWVKASNLNANHPDINVGFVIKKFNQNYKNEESSYYYHDNGCIMNLPTDNVFETYEEFAVSTGNLQYDNQCEYYYCECDTHHLLYQQEHTFEYHNFDNSNHVKYCDCGYSINENHALYHHTFTDGHYEVCEKCSYNNPHPDGVVYEVLYEMQHSWTCNLCNESGNTSHAFHFESAGLNNHFTSCLICNYENLVPHGTEFDIWYYRIDENTHSATCSCCGEDWIENHTPYCPCS